MPVLHCSRITDEFCMHKLFNKILVPVNFNRNTRWSIDKAVQLANRFDCDLFLLHVQAPPPAMPYLSDAFFTGSLMGTPRIDPGKKMKELECQYKPKLKEGLILTSATRTGYWQPVLKDVIIAEHIDLALIPRSKKQLVGAVIRRININKLTQQTNCPIMTITRNFNANHLQNIVVPVFDLLPVKKLTIATYFSLETTGCIYLVGRNNHAAVKTEDYLIKAYQLLNDFGKLNIQCALRDNDDTATSTLAYAKDVKANLIVVNPGQESRLKGWWNKLRGKYLCRESDIPVLTIT